MRVMRSWHRTSKPVSDGFGLDFAQDPLLALPYDMAGVIFNRPPQVPRPLKEIERKRKAQYLELAEILARRFARASSERAIDFLIDLCQNRDAGILTPLPWFEAHGAPAVIHTRPGPPQALARLVPAMRLQIRFRQ